MLITYTGQIFSFTYDYLAFSYMEYVPGLIRIEKNIHEDKTIVPVYFYIFFGSKVNYIMNISEFVID